MLDLSQVAIQIKTIVDQLKTSQQERQERLALALRLLNDNTHDFSRLQAKAVGSQNTASFLIAGPVEPLPLRQPPIPTPLDFSIIATDGSQIDVDRHQSAYCYLINIGRVQIDYGHESNAKLESLPKLCADDNSIVISDGYHEQVVKGELLGIRRSVDEFRHLRELAQGLPSSKPALAIVDGSLILWDLASKEYPKFVVEELLNKGFLQDLSVIKHLSQKQPLALASYISYPRSTDVVNLLRMELCPFEYADCRKHCRDKLLGNRPCNTIAGVLDRDLFLNHLADGERSAVFFSQAKMVTEKYEEHLIHFFYLRIEDEIARVEIPLWIAKAPHLLNLTHTLLVDQCKRGGAYPIALSEAHEQAVVNSVDKESFQHLLADWITGEQMDYTYSAKSRTKKTRWL
ncbi:MAG: DNA double-strand break repair nuclease NurA [Dehalococcoidia bacterium]|nr:DNA double-strand break repair nuclease NurA [Dehalococcoidia bacterium]